jgi:hypothetical protein
MNEVESATAFLMIAIILGTRTFCFQVSRLFGWLPPLIVPCRHRSSIAESPLQTSNEYCTECIRAYLVHVCGTWLI